MKCPSSGILGRMLGAIRRIGKEKKREMELKLGMTPNYIWVANRIVLGT